MTTEAVVESVRTNTDRGPINARRSYWPTAVGSNISLALGGYYPREIRVHVGGDLVVTYTDNTTETIKSIPDGAIFVDCCWTAVTASGSTAYALSFGW